MDSASPQKWDFIIVCAGASGCALASCLARSKKHPSVLLVDAGGENSGLEIRVDAERCFHRRQPEMNWGYATVPQKNLDGAVLQYDRGKGLGV